MMSLSFKMDLQRYFMWKHLAMFFMLILMESYQVTEINDTWWLPTSYPKQWEDTVLSYLSLLQWFIVRLFKMSKQKK